MRLPHFHRGAVRPGSRTLQALCLFLPAFVSAQEFNFRHYTQDDGLRNQVAQCLLQDRSGFLWVGTQNGLFRYDGSRFRGYYQTDGLPSNWITGLHEDKLGILWIATRTGIARFSNRGLETFPGLGDYEIPGHAALASDESGTIYVGTNRGLLLLRSPDGGAHFDGDFRNPGIDTGPIFSLHIDAEGFLWLACHNQIMRFDRYRLSAPAAVYASADGVPKQRWNAVITDSAGDVWARSSEHLIVLRKGSKRFVPVDRGLPFSTYDNGVLGLDRKNRLFVPTDLGLCYRGGSQWDCIGRSRGLTVDSASCFLEDREGSVWIGLSGGGIARWVGYGEWESWTHAEGLSNDAIWSIQRDSTGTLWVGSDRGLNYQLKGERVWRQWRGSGLDQNKVRGLLQCWLECG